MINAKIKYPNEDSLQKKYFLEEMMFTKNKVKRMIIVMAAVVLLLFSSNSHVVANQGGSPAPLMLVQGDKTDSTEGERVTIPGGPGYLMLSAYEFKPYNTETSFAYSGFVELYNPLSTEGYYVAPVNLPDHAVITQVVFYWWDTVSGVDSTLYLMANTAGSYSYWNIGTLYSSGYSGLGTTVLYMPPSSVEVDNSDTVYFLRLTLQGGYGYNLTLLQVRIDYAYSSYMPVIKK